MTIPSLTQGGPANSSDSSSRSCALGISSLITDWPLVAGGRSSRMMAWLSALAKPMDC